MRTWGAVVAAACPESHFPQLEVGEELIPFPGGEIAVFLAGPLGPAACDERPAWIFHGYDRVASG